MSTGPTTRALSPRDARIAELYEHGLTSARIARLLNIPAGSVRDALARLRAGGHVAAVAPAAREKLVGRGLAAVLDGIEAEAGRRAKLARMDYVDATAKLKAEHLKRQAAIAAEEREALKAIERWRLKTIAAAGAGPVPLDEMRSMREGRA